MFSAITVSFSTTPPVSDLWPLIVCSILNVDKLLFCVSSAGVLPGVPHQKGLRRDRAEHLPPQPRVRSHVLTFWSFAGSRRVGWGGVRVGLRQ